MTTTLDPSGAMHTGWLKTGNDWYYLGKANDGAMKTGWQQVNGKWYYMNTDGKMAVNTWIGNWYVDGSGAWTKTKQPAQWIKSGNRWWYRHEDGGYTANGFETIGGQTYYFDASGWMVTGWKAIKNEWYYFNASGAMATNAWIDGNYYVGADGKMAKDTWIGSWYVDGNGKWVPNKKKEPEQEENGLESISLDKENASLWIGEETTLQVSCKPEDAIADKSVKWSSSDSNVATVENGKVSGVGEGTVTITAEIAGKKASCEVNVVKKFRISVDFDVERLGYLPFGIDETDKDGAVFSIMTDDYDDSADVEWSVSDESVVKLEVERWQVILGEDNTHYVTWAYLFGLKEGTTTLTASYKGKNVSVDIQTKKVSELQDLRFAQETYTRKVGEKFTLLPDTYPSNGYMRYSPYYESSNPEVATAYDGVIRAKKEGYTTITAIYGGPGPQIITSCTLKVEGRADDNTELEMIKYEPPESFSVRLGVKTKLNIVVYPVTHPYEDSDIKLTVLGGWGIDGGGNAVIEDGKIIGTKAGDVRVRASMDGCEPIEFDVNVTE